MGRKVWVPSGTFSLQGLTDGMGGLLKQPAYKKLASWLARESETGGEWPKFCPQG